MALGSSISLSSLCWKEPGKKGWRRDHFAFAADPRTNHPELLCENAGARRWMKGQGQRREGTAGSKIVNWRGNPGKNPTFHVCRVGTYSRARTPELPYRYWRKRAPLTEQI